MDTHSDHLLSDTDLIDSCLNEFPHSTRSFEVILGRYEPAIYRYCLHYLRDHHDAEEVTMDIFAQVYFRLPQLEDSTAFKAWLYRIAGRQCANRYRKRIRQRTFQEEYSDTEMDQAHTVEQSPGQRINPAEVAMSRALHEVSTQDREVLILRHVNELSFEALAETLDISISASKMRLYRAEERLRRILEGVIGKELAGLDLALMIFFYWGVTFHRPT